MIGDVVYRNVSGALKNPLSPNAVWKGVPDGIEWRTAALTIVDDTSYVEEGYGIHVERDALGRVTKKTETLDDIPAVQNYEYDLAGRLVGVTGDTNGNTSESWAYDTNGNRTHRNGSLIATFDAQDRILTQGGTSYSHNARGQRSEKNQLGQITRYDYDVFGGLKSVTLPDATTITYAQDPLGRRIGRKVNGTWTNKWLYKDQLNPIAELDANDRLKKLFVYADKAHVPAYMIAYDVNGNETGQYRIVSDLLGSVRVVYDLETGNEVQRIDYDVWGVVASDTNQGFQPFAFAGGLYDPQTGLVRFGARDYEAETARWLAKDPIGFAGGDTNLYGYIANDPVNWIDPSGLAPVEYYLNKWMCGSASWEEALNKARKEKMGPFDPSDPMDDDNRTAAEHYFFARYIGSGEAGIIPAVAFWASGSYWVYGYQVAKMMGLYPNSSPPSYAQLYWGARGYTDAVGLTETFRGKPGGSNCSCGEE